MTALYILAAVACIIAIPFLCRIYFSFSYSGGEASILLRYAFLRIHLLPSKQGKIKLGDYTFEKVAQRQAAEKKKDAKKQSSPKKPKKKEAAKSKKSDEGEGTEKKSAISLLLTMREIIFDTIKRFPGKLRLEILRLRLSVGAEDAAATAIGYGAVTQAVGAALTLAEEHADVRIRRDAVMILPDFLSGKLDADVSVRLSVRVGSVFGLALRFIFNFIKLKAARQI